MSEVERVLSVRNGLGEGPVWSVAEQALYWIDISRDCFWRYEPATGAHERVDVGVQIGVLALRVSGGIVLATKQGFVFWDQAQRRIVPIVDPNADKPSLRFNDGAVDCAGRFWAGSMENDESLEARVGVLYRLDPDLSLHEMDSGFIVPNGIGWSPDNRTMYLTDSLLRAIFAYDFDAASGAISNQRMLVQVPEEHGLPDGLCMDDQGYIWSACWDGAQILRYDPNGKIERTVKVPALRPTSCIFGGPALNELYITSSSDDLSKTQLAQYPYSGDLLRVNTEFHGPERYKFGG